MMRIMLLMLVRKSSKSIPNEQPPRLLNPPLQPTLLRHLLNPPFNSTYCRPTIFIISFICFTYCSSSLYTFYAHTIHDKGYDWVFLPSTSSLPIKPNSFAKAFQDVGWHANMIAEFDALLVNSIWDLVPPPFINLIGCKWIYKIKQKADGSLEHLKAQLVIQGYKQ